ncbi:ABC transporter ATP-binding protein [Bacillus sp. T3]|uniref:ABC transporter ATP-binding protein n=1 Tax=Bacillus sp. T3 TaxID=467262 RepID=UPI002981BBC4|nr:ABC transporter ATP-binding protein [Bacillus sp. T3]
MTSFISVSGLYKSFGQQKVLENVNFKVEKGEIVGLLGPNGSGKTTFIRILNGVIKPEKGSILLNGMDPDTEGDSIRKISGIVTESAGLYHQMSGKENLELFAELYGVTDKKRVTVLLDLFDLTEHRDKPVGKYSTWNEKAVGIG